LDSQSQNSSITIGSVRGKDALTLNAAPRSGKRISV
jgi:hypothetical protein